MAKIGDTYDTKSNSLKVEDLNRKRVNVTISEVEVKQFDDGKKFILHFEGTDKTFVLNVTNARMMEMLTGSDDSDDWAGYKITLRPDMTQFNGKPTPCIRIDSELPEQPQKAKAATASVDDDDSVPF